MKHWIDTQKPQQQHEVWLVEHPSVYSQGQAGKSKHILNLHGIPLVQSDRGGQITYHGPGQLICYFLFDLERLQLNVRQLVAKTTDSVIQYLSELGIAAQDDSVNPGVYVEGSKIASLGFRIRRHMSYHGVAINLNMDLTPFLGINPCGLTQSVCQASDLALPALRTCTHHDLQDIYLHHITKTFTFDDVIVERQWPRACL